ncbi:hypothetical protein ANOM_001715 [Aspergillus nomiae NRRL 13137]|uniref:Uncharacterized protein n=1 Tax=Aspergillus nomiae NRRL (strain ATCC 15546 / NRRL 13137 / CBS 260.88 / M93) TaxID=1509407 RepID=A0A0L1JDW4_ASPN3|nr:uncharacterized protein ANOM_001715 [Aspergillus nomiae NRRL 13137]KNG89925.1 hypothetical protein ANOM_001715 [Aspergillus nomiae NRRL 13137]
MAFPPASAGPNAVRAYLSDILVAKHDATADFANEVASRWQLGRPNDLRHASTGTFERVFGKDVGNFLYRSVQEDIREQRYSSTAGVFNSWVLVCSVVVSVFFLIRATRASASSASAAALRYAGLAFGPPMVFCGVQDHYSQWQFARLFLGGIVCFLTFLAFLVASTDPYMEKQKIETGGRRQGKVERKE